MGNFPSGWGVIKYLQATFIDAFNLLKEIFFLAQVLKQRDEKNPEEISLDDSMLTHYKLKHLHFTQFHCLPNLSF